MGSSHVSIIPLFALEHKRGMCRVLRVTFHAQVASLDGLEYNQYVSNIDMRT